MSNIVYIATSIDGYIADKDGGLDWLNTVPNPNNSDCGFAEFIAKIDAIVMGRITYETVMGFDVDWPYTKPVYVLSQTLKSIPIDYRDKVSLLKGAPAEIVKTLRKKRAKHLYIDGGTTIQQFLKANLIDEMIITTVPILLGGGHSLFGSLAAPINFKLIQSKTLLNSLVQNHYQREKNIGTANDTNE